MPTFCTVGRLWEFVQSVLVVVPQVDGEDSISLAPPDDWTLDICGLEVLRQGALLWRHHLQETPQRGPRRVLGRLLVAQMPEL